MIKNYRSIVDSSIKQKIRESEWVEDMVHYGLYKNQLDGTLAAAALFCPEIVCVKDYIFVKMFLNNQKDEDLVDIVNKLEKSYDYCKKKIEMAINSYSVGDFFLNDDSELINDVDALNHFGEVLCYFWQMRVNQLFPDKSIVVELGHELMGELGLCITMYEND